MTHGEIWFVDFGIPTGSLPAYPSEKNPGGVNYAVINPAILTPVGVE